MRMNANEVSLVYTYNLQLDTQHPNIIRLSSTSTYSANLDCILFLKKIQGFKVLSQYRSRENSETIALVRKAFFFLLDRINEQHLSPI